MEHQRDRRTARTDDNDHSKGPNDREGEEPELSEPKIIEGRHKQGSRKPNDNDLTGERYETGKVGQPHEHSETDKQTPEIEMIALRKHRQRAQTYEQ